MKGQLGPYELGKLIGQGGMGSVYRARETATGREVALKLITGVEADPIAIERFAREVKVAASIAHPNVVRLLHYGTAEHPETGRSVHYYAMDLIDGESLSELLEQRTLTPAEAIVLGGKVAGALGAAHAIGVVHRDVKPGNILIDRAGEPYLTDFGLARMQEVSRSLTRTGVVVGTPVFMAPEQAEGEEVTPASDVFSLGAVLYQAISGEPVRTGLSLTDLVVEALTRDPRPLGRIPGVQVSGDIDLVIGTCLERDPARRYADGAALGDELGRLTRGEPIRARPPSLAYRLRKWIGRNPAVSGLILLSLLAAGGLAGSGWYRRRQADRLRHRFTRELAEQRVAHLARIAGQLEEVGSLDQVSQLQSVASSTALRETLSRWTADPRWSAIPASRRELALNRNLSQAAPAVLALRARLHARRAGLERGFDDRVAELTRAYCLDPGSTTGRRAYLELGQRYFEKGQYHSVRGVFENLLGRHPDTDEGRSARSWLGRTMLRLGRFDEATALLPPAHPEARLAAALRGSRELPGSSQLRHVHRFALWPATRTQPPAICLLGDQLAIYRHPYDRPPVMVELGRRLARAIAADVDGDGQTELILTTTEEHLIGLVQLRNGRPELRWKKQLTSGWNDSLAVLSGGSPTRLLTAAKGGTALRMITVDGDTARIERFVAPGFREGTDGVVSLARDGSRLYLGLGPWAAFDLRVHRLTAARAGERLASHKMGSVEGVLPGRFVGSGQQVAALVHGAPIYRIPTIFGDDLERLSVNALCLFAAPAEPTRAWKPLRRFTTGRPLLAREGVGGLQAIRVGAERPWLRFWRQLPSPAVRGTQFVRFLGDRTLAVHLRRRRLVVLGDLDGDGEDELVERSSSGSWAIRGLRQPQEASFRPRSQPLPQARGATLSLLLARELIGLELWSAAQGVLVSLDDERQPAGVRLRARPALLECLIGLARWEQAAELAGKLGREPAALARVTRIRRHQADWPALAGALRRLTRTPAAPPQVRARASREADRLDRFNGRRPRVKLDFRAQPPQVLPLPHPLGLRWQAGQGLLLRTILHAGGPELRWPLVLDGGPFELSFNLRLDRLDWGASLKGGLYHLQGDQARRVIDFSLGRGGAVDWNNDQGPVFGDVVSFQSEHRGDRLIAPADHTLRIRWPGPGYPMALHWQMHGRSRVRLGLDGPSLFPPGRYELRLENHSRDVRPAFCARILLRSITLSAASDRCRLGPIAPPDSLQRAHRALIAGRHAEAARGYEALLARRSDPLIGLFAGLAWHRAGKTRQGLAVASRHWKESLWDWCRRRLNLLTVSDLQFLGAVLPRIVKKGESVRRYSFRHICYLVAVGKPNARLVYDLTRLGYHELAIALARRLPDDPIAAWYAAKACFRLDRYVEALRRYLALRGKPRIPADLDRRIRLCRWRIKVTSEAK